MLMKKNLRIEKNLGSIQRAFLTSLLYLLSSILCLLTFSFCLLSSHLAYAQSGEWTWMKGDSTINSVGVFGTQGVADPQNTPPGFYEAAEWKDLDGNLWLYGGLGPPFSEFGDLWKFDIAANEWTWVKGSGLPLQSPVYGTLGIPSPSNTPGARSWGVATWVGLDGCLYLYGGLALGGWFADLWKYNIATNEWTWIGGSQTLSLQPSYGTQGVASPTNIPGSRAETNATWVDSLGNLWFFGGWDGSNAYNDLWKFDISTMEWTWMKGFNGGNQFGTYGTLGVAAPANTPGARLPYGKWKDQYGKFWLFAGYQATNSELYDDVWKYDPDTNEWTWESGSNLPNPMNVVSSNCDPEINNRPSGRHESRACCSDCAGHFWTFGAFTSTGGIGSDLWLFNSNTLEWSLVNGTIQTNNPGFYGTQGVASPNNYPQSRWGALSWMDNNCEVWVWGGANSSGNDLLNDLWKFIPDPDCPSNVSCSLSCIQNSVVAFTSSATSLCEKFCTNFYDSSANNPTAWQWIFQGGSPSSSTDQNPVNICYQTPGVFDVTLITTSANGNDTLTLNNYMTVFATPPFPTITQTGYTLTCSPASFYQWQLNAADISGATNQSYSVTQSGLYTVIVSDSNGCVNSSSQYVLIDGIAELYDGSQFIYPNPSNGSFILDFTYLIARGGLMSDDIVVDVVNTLGQKIFSSHESPSPGTSFNKKKEINLGVVANGVYFIEIKSQNIFLRNKIIITN